MTMVCIHYIYKSYFQTMYLNMFIAEHMMTAANMSYGIKLVTVSA